jgi:hypothetical protein
MLDSILTRLLVRLDLPNKRVKASQMANAARPVPRTRSEHPEPMISTLWSRATSQALPADELVAPSPTGASGSSTSKDVAFWGEASVGMWPAREEDS